MVQRFHTGEEVRTTCRDGHWTGPTCGQAPGYTQANLVMLPADWAFDFLLFCQRNPQACPLIEVTSPGEIAPALSAPHSDLRCDLPRYRVWKEGVLVDEPTDVLKYWREDFVSFLIGCSFTFETALCQAGLQVRHLELGCNVPMYRTNQPCVPAGRFWGPMVVSMRPFSPRDAIRAIEVTSAFPGSHGAPVHLGFPEQIGITHLNQPDFGDPVPVGEGEIPVFWACGVTPQTVLMAARPPLAITHSPGCMFLTDRRDAGSF